MPVSSNHYAGGSPFSDKKGPNYLCVKNLKVHSQNFLKFDVSNIGVHLELNTVKTEKTPKTAVSIFETALKP